MRTKRRQRYSAPTPILPMPIAPNKTEDARSQQHPWRGWLTWFRLLRANQIRDGESLEGPIRTGARERFTPCDARNRARDRVF